MVPELSQKAVTYIPRPAMQGFLGLINFYRQLIPVVATEKQLHGGGKGANKNHLVAGDAGCI